MIGTKVQLILGIEVYCQKLQFSNLSDEYYWGAPKCSDISRFERVYTDIHTHHQSMQPEQQIMNCPHYKQIYLWGDNKQLNA